MKLDLTAVAEYPGDSIVPPLPIIPSPSIVPSPPITTEPDHPNGKELVPGMSFQDWWILSLILRGQTITQISAIVGMDPIELRSHVERPTFKEQLTIQVKTMVENITSGAYGVSAIAKANAPNAMRRIIELLHQTKDPRIALQASEKCLNYAGFQPIRRVETFNTYQLLPKMDQGELMHYALTAEFPDRLEDEARRLKAKSSDSPDSIPLSSIPSGPRALDTPQKVEFGQTQRLDPDDEFDLAPVSGSGQRK